MFWRVRWIQVGIGYFSWCLNFKTEKKTWRPVGTEKSGQIAFRAQLSNFFFFLLALQTVFKFPSQSQGLNIAINTHLLSRTLTIIFYILPILKLWSFLNRHYEQSSEVLFVHTHVLSWRFGETKAKKELATRWFWCVCEQFVCCLNMTRPLRGGRCTK